MTVSRLHKIKSMAQQSIPVPPHLVAELDKMQIALNNLLDDMKQQRIQFAKAQTDRTQLVQQQTESEHVLKEINTVTDDDTIYKAVGPLLIPQDADTARENVQRRVAFIKERVAASDKTIDAITDKMSATKSAITELQAAAQAKIAAEKKRLGMA